MILRTMAPWDDFTRIDRDYRTYLAASLKTYAVGPGFDMTRDDAERLKDHFRCEAIGFASR